MCFLSERGEVIVRRFSKLGICLLSAQTLALANSGGSQAFGIPSLWDLYDLGGWAIEKINAFSDKAVGYDHAYWFLSQMSEKASDWYDWLSNKAKAFTFRKPKDVERLLKEGFKRIKGQERAKKEVMNFALGISHEKNNALMRKEKRKGADIILFTGTSGCGKSMMARELAHALSTAPPVIISAGDVDINDKESIVSQIFGTRQKQYGDYRYQKPNEKNCLLLAIERIPHLVIIVDEYDKMYSPAFDEVLRAFSDNGTANLLGQKVDASNVTFILTSNESVRSAKPNKKADGKKDQANGASVGVPEKNTENATGQPKNEENKPINSTPPDDANANVPEESTENAAEQPKNEENKAIDNTPYDPSRTEVKRDVSAMNRYTHIEFDSLTNAEYVGIAKKEFEESLLKYWKKYANIDLDLSNIYESVAKKAATMEEHGRAIRKLIRKLVGTLSKNEKKLKGKKVTVYYDDEENQFVLVVK